MPTKEQFLTAKLKNFRSFVEPYCQTPELQAHLRQFQSLEDVMPYLLQVAALVRAGQRQLVLDQFCSPFGDAADEPFRARVERYIQMFADVLTS
jgi:hypothetical protein